MKKYSNKQILDYINNKIGARDIIDDPIFIQEAVQLTNDIEIYDLCNINLKVDYSLVKFFISKFRYNINFVLKVAENFIKLSMDRTDKWELNIIIRNLYHDINDERLIKYDIRADAEYNKLALASMIELKSSNKEVQDYYQMGFDYIIKEYKGREVIIDYVAKKMVNEIFDFDLEDYIHQSFSNKEELTKIGINNYIIDMISLKDKNLAEYVAVNINLIKDIHLKIDKILYNFDKYQKENNNVFQKELINYIEDYAYEYDLDIVNIVKYIAYDLKIDLNTNMNFNQEDYQLIKNDLYYKILKKKVMTIIKTGIIPDLHIEDKGKVLSFKKM